MVRSGWQQVASNPRNAPERCSRTQANRDLAINKMAAMGAQLTSTEMALFELQKVAEGEQFKRLINVLK